MSLHREPFRHVFCPWHRPPQEILTAPPSRRALTIYAEGGVVGSHSKPRHVQPGRTFRGRERKCPLQERMTPAKLAQPLRVHISTPQVSLLPPKLQAGDDIHQWGWSQGPGEPRKRNSPEEAIPWQAAREMQEEMNRGRGVTIFMTNL